MILAPHALFWKEHPALQLAFSALFGVALCLSKAHYGPP